MAKTVTVQAQQMWEYTSITRKTPDYLVAELNEAGRLGWELVGASYHKETKTSVSELFCWTAILKRPLILPASTATGDVMSGDSSSAPSSAPSSGIGGVPSPGTDSSIFDVRPDEDDLEGGNT
jgi:hypothetical protein